MSAEEDFLLLSIDRNLIGVTDALRGPVTNRDEALRLVIGYHHLLTADVQRDANSLHEQMLNLIPDFELAYTAADSAEITHVMSEIDLRLATISEIHAAHFNREVLELLTDAYMLILPTFGDK
ncbi:MAG: hypothetical protein WDZ52_14965 [Pseudohongiellaceae bacterium]